MQGNVQLYNVRIPVHVYAFSHLPVQNVDLFAGTLGVALLLGPFFELLQLALGGKSPDSLELEWPKAVSCFSFAGSNQGA